MAAPTIKLRRARSVTVHLSSSRRRFKSRRGLDEEIVREGSTGTALYIVLSGTGRVVRGGETLGEVKAGDFFGELALIEEHPRSASVVAAVETECLLFPAWEFTALLEEHPEIAVPIMRALIGRLPRREHHGA